KTRATPQDDGSYRINGTKIFITAGEHDFTDNIVHLVLARLPDAPEGSRGISLFVVPKLQVNEDGSVGGPNGVRCGAIEHKMGIHGSATCVLNLDDARGWLVGEPHRGLMAMFTMMNSARVAVGIQGLGLADRAYQNALAYSRERLQMRALSGPKFPDKAADPIIVHPDVRRMLLTCKALTEGGRVLACVAGTRVDAVTHATDAALQCFGGHGYIAEHGMEQLARDARITTLYEGTTGIQALDLMGRKTMQLKAAGLKAFLAMVNDFCSEHADDATMAEFISPLRDKATEWEQLTREIAQRASSDPEEIGAASWDYLFYSGYVTLAYWWARSAVAARSGAQTEQFRQSKLETARFYFARILPRTLAHKAAIESGAGPLMALDADGFD